MLVEMNLFYWKKDSHLIKIQVNLKFIFKSEMERKKKANNRSKGTLR